MIYIDTETRSEVLLSTGVARYAAGDDFEVLMVQYAFDDEPVRVWETREEPVPKRLASRIAKGETVVMHNSPFDRTVLREAGIFDIPPMQIHDTMVMALAHGFPGSLDVLCKIFGLGEQGKLDGKLLIKTFCQPDKKTGVYIEPEDEPAMWEQFLEYGRYDIVSTREIYKKLPKTNYPNMEHGLWVVDQIINDRGIPVDVEFAEAAAHASDGERERMNNKVLKHTGGKASGTQRDKLLAHILEDYGVALPDMRAGTLERRIADDELPRPLRDLLQMRVDTAQVAGTKYRRVTGGHVGGRLKHTLQFCGAAKTGRDCLAEGSPVVTSNGVKPIEQVTTNDLVWDGHEWVEHDGVEFSGDKPVMEWDGVTATKDHIVYVSDTESMRLEDAAREGKRIWRSLCTDCQPSHDEGSPPPSQARTYDIINAGPRNRFSLEGGQIISNSGKIFQPQNLKRPTIWKKVPDDQLGERIEQDVQCVKDGMAPLLYEDRTQELLGSLVRSVVKAPDGEKIVQSDLAGIEGRVLPWFASEGWKLELFRKLDAGEAKFDNYETTYASMFRVPAEEVGKKERQIGKVCELSLGYAGGVGAFLNMADIYKLDIEELAASVWKSGDYGELIDCKAKHKWALENEFDCGLPPDEYAACEYIKRKWRESHQNTLALWSDLEEGFTKATRQERKVFKYGRLKFFRKGSLLCIALPSGRLLVYSKPKVDSNGLSFVGLDGYTRKWKRMPTFSGRLAENVVSGTARDILIGRMPEIEEAGYKIIMRVHDEIVATTPDTDQYTWQELAEIMTRPWEWAPGLPLAADGYESYRYRK